MPRLLLTEVALVILWLFHANSSPTIADAKSLWSGGVEWGTAVTSRANAYWQDDGAVPSGRPFVDVAVGGELLTSSAMSASWNLGIGDFLADLAPNTASLRFHGSISATFGDDVVISTGWGAQWAGYVDTIAVTRDTAGDSWTTIGAIDKVGILGQAELRDSAGVTGTLDEIAVSLAADAGVTIDVTDTSDGTYGLPELRRYVYFGENYEGTVLEYLNAAARSSNAWFVLGPDGRYSVQTREALLSSPSTIDLTGDDAPVTWTLSYRLDTNVNRWVFVQPDGTEVPSTNDAADIARYGERAYRVDTFLDTDVGSGVALAFLDWWATGGIHRAVADGEFVISDFSQYDLLRLAPLDWVTESGVDYQVLSMSWTAEPGQPLRLSIVADPFRDLLEVAS